MCFPQRFVSSLTPGKGLSPYFCAFIGSLLEISVSFTPEWVRDGKVSLNQIFQVKLISEEEGVHCGRWGEVSGL